MADLQGGSIVWDLDVNADKFKQGLKEAQQKAEETGASLKSVAEKAIVPLGVGFASVTGIMYGAIKAFSDSENVVAQLDAVLKSTGGAAGMTRDSVLELSSALQQQSKFDDEAITGAQNMLLTFTSIGKDVFPEATKTVLDMSQALGQDLKSSSIQLGKALNDPINGVTALKRVGVSFNEEQLKTIEHLQKSGDIMGAQKLILQELGKEFGGSALASSKTFSGQIEIAKNNVNDLAETIGGGLLEALNSIPGGLTGINGALVNLNSFFKEHKDVLMGVSFALIAVALTLGGLLLAALIVTAGAASAWVLGIGALAIALGFLAGVIVGQFQYIKAIIQENLAFADKLFKDFCNNVLIPLPDVLAGALTKVINYISNFLSVAVRNVSYFFSDLGFKARGWWNELINFYNSSAGRFIESVISPWTSVLRQVIEIAGKIKKAANEINPFVKHSPSLVENVQKGIGIIKDEYASLGKISIPPINHQYAPAVIQSPSVAGGGTSKIQNISVTVGSISGRGDIESLVRELGYRSEL